MADWTDPRSTEVPHLPGIVEPAEPGQTCIQPVDGVPHGVPAEHVLIVGDKRLAYCKPHARRLLDLGLGATGDRVEERWAKTHPKSGGCALPLLMVLCLAVLLAACGGGGSGTAAAKWEEYRTWLHGPWVVTMAQHMDTWNTNIDGSKDALLRDGRAILSDLPPAISWLDAHPPEACYSEAHRLLRAYLDGLRSSLTATLDAMERDDRTSMLTGMQGMADAFKLRDQSGTAYDAVRC